MGNNGGGSGIPEMIIPSGVLKRKALSKSSLTNRVPWRTIHYYCGFDHLQIRPGT
jgi:hypothetical protein